MIEVYNRLGYDGVAVGNHEFDFGPIGTATVAQSPADDPVGGRFEPVPAKRDFHFCLRTCSNVRPGKASFVKTVAGIKVGIVGLSTEATPRTTLPRNVADLQFQASTALREQCARLRAQGAQVILVAAHLGGRCSKLQDPSAVESCEPNEELMSVLHALPSHTADVIVAGHTHQAMAHFVRDTAVVQAWSGGRAFGRVDLVVDQAQGRIVRRDVFPPQDICSPEEGKARSSTARSTKGNESSTMPWCKVLCKRPWTRRGYSAKPRCDSFNPHPACLAGRISLGKFAHRRSLAGLSWQ